MPLRDTHDIHKDCVSSADTMTEVRMPALLEDAMQSYLVAITDRMDFITTRTVDTMSISQEAARGAALDSAVVNAEKLITAALANQDVKKAYPTRMLAESAVAAYKSRMSQEPGYDRMLQSYRAA